VRFLLGGAIVSAFAVTGEVFKPKTFAGIFGAAPAVALASLALAYGRHGSGYVLAEAVPMLIGAIAFYVYAAVCLLGVRSNRVPVWLSAVLSWGAWFAVAFAMLGIGTQLGVLP